MWSQKKKKKKKTSSRRIIHVSPFIHNEITTPKTKREGQESTTKTSLHSAWPPKFKNQALFTPRAQNRFLFLDYFYAVAGRNLEACLAAWKSSSPQYARVQRSGLLLRGLLWRRYTGTQARTHGPMALFHYFFIVVVPQFFFQCHLSTVFPLLKLFVCCRGVVNECLGLLGVALLCGKILDRPIVAAVHERKHNPVQIDPLLAVQPESAAEDRFVLSAILQDMAIF